MPLLAEILAEYLSKEDLQRIAREHDLPVSRTKEEIVGELLALDDLEPDEAVAFMDVAQLRYFCQEHGLPSGAYRDVLVDRVLTAIEEEEHPAPRARRKKRVRSIVPKAGSPIPAGSHPDTNGISSPPEIQVRHAPSQPKPIEIVLPPAPPPQISVRVRQPPSAPVEVQVQPSPPPAVLVRPHPPQMAAWGFIGVVAASVFGGIYFVTTAAFGIAWGVVVGILCGFVVASVLLVPRPVKLSGLWTDSTFRGSAMPCSWSSESAS